MKRDTGKEQNRVFSETLNSRGYVHQEMVHATLTLQTLENAVMDQEMKHPTTEAEEKRYKAGNPRETIAEREYGTQDQTD